MPAFPLRAALAAFCLLAGGLTHAAPPPALDKDPVGFLRFVQSSPAPRAKVARRAIAAGPASLARERALAQGEGIAVFPAQLNRPLPPDDQNAAPLYLKAEALRRGKLRLPNYAETLSARYAYTPEQLSRIQKIYDDNPEVFALLHQATDRPLCVFPRDWTKDAFAFPSQFAGLRESARELRTESVLLAERGRFPEAILTQTRGYRLAQHTASDPTLISYLVAEAMEAITTSGMQDILTLAGPNAAVDAQVVQAVTDHSARLSLRHALSGEVALADAGFSLLRRGGGAGMDNLFRDADAGLRPAKAAFSPGEQRFYTDLLDAAEADYIHHMRAAIRLADTPDRAAILVRMSWEVQSPAAGLVQEVARRLSPLQFDILNDVPLRSAASHAITRAAAAVLTQRAKTGAYPDALPGAFPDPYTGKPLGYRREGADGFVVYSAGPDGKYDGGRPGEQMAPGQAGFRYLAVPVPVPKEMQ